VHGEAAAGGIDVGDAGRGAPTSRSPPTVSAAPSVAGSSAHAISRPAIASRPLASAGAQPEAAAAFVHPVATTEDVDGVAHRAAADIAERHRRRRRARAVQWIEDDATLPATATRSALGRTTLWIASAPLAQKTPLALQLQSFAHPLWTIQHVASAPVATLRRSGRLRAIASLRGSCRPAAGRVAALSSLRASIRALNEGSALAPTIATIATTTAASRSEKPSSLGRPVRLRASSPCAAL
jgi:hypothetical protein